MALSFSEKLQFLRKGKGMSQEKLAEEIGVSRQAVSKWESGQAYPDVDKLVLLSRLFGVSIDRLVKGEEDFAAQSGDNTYSNNQRNYNNNSYFNFKSCIHYEYKSKRRLFNVPLIHINVGSGVYVAKGILAIGNISVGLLSIGAIAVGGLSIGALALGLISLAAIGLGLVLSFGGVAIGAVAIGGMALGIFTLGGLSIGMFSIGGCAVASDIAIGGYASGHIAIGEIVNGTKTIVIPKNQFNTVSASRVRALITQEYPHLWKPIVDWITSIFNQLPINM